MFMLVPLKIKPARKGTVISNTILPETSYRLQIAIISKILKQNECK